MTSTIKVNTVTTESGSTLTIGESGKTIALASGASQTGFGRTGTVDWQTTVKTVDFTAANGEGYFVNTTSGEIDVTLPSSPSAGNIVAVMDYANTAATNNINILRNGSKIDGVEINAKMNVNGQSFTLVFVDSTQGWKTVNNANTQINTALFVAATGGTVTTCGDFKIHTFTGPGNFIVSCAGNSGGSNTLDYLVVAGGGGAGGRNCNNGPAGGGAGGFRYSAATYTSPSCAPGHPLRSPTGLTAAAQTYPVVVGGGGAGGSGGGSPTGAPGTVGVNSSFSTITSAGGGFGAKAGCSSCGSGDGGSGGGNPSNVDHNPSPAYVGAGNVPPVSPPQGNPGGSPTNDNGGSGGGGATAAGGATPNPDNAGNGGAGAGIPTAFGSNGVANPSPDAFRYYAGGGAGGARMPPVSGGTGGIGGGGNSSSPGGIGNGTDNTGGGGGGGRGAPNPPGCALTGGTGGSGVVVIRYKFQ